MLSDWRTATTCSTAAWLDPGIGTSPSSGAHVVLSRDSHATKWPRKRQIRQQNKGLRRLGRIRQNGFANGVSPKRLQPERRLSLIFPSNFWLTHVSHRIMRRGGPTGRINETVFLVVCRHHRSNLRLQ